MKWYHLMKLYHFLKPDHFMQLYHVIKLCYFMKLYHFSKLYNFIKLYHFVKLYTFMKLCHFMKLYNFMKLYQLCHFWVIFEFSKFSKYVFGMRMSDFGRGVFLITFFSDLTSFCLFWTKKQMCGLMDEWVDTTNFQINLKVWLQIVLILNCII